MKSTLVREGIVFVMTATAVIISCTPTRTLAPPEDADRVAAGPEPVIPVVIVSRPPAQPQDAEAPVTRPERCPAGMLPVTGTYCGAVEHRCLEGRTVSMTAVTPGGMRTVSASQPVHCPNGCATPYFCDKFVKGHAVCKGKETPKQFCVDDYEYPNKVGETPMVMVTWIDADKLCKAQGKRLCGDDEWTLACEGQERRPYSYGWERDASKCNIDKTWRAPNTVALFSRNKDVAAAELAKLDQRVPIGSTPDCVSPYGIHDMNGNVDEWTRNVTHGGRPYVSLFKGGHWAGARNRCRPDTDAHGPDFAFYAEGFRCCADMK